MITFLLQILANAPWERIRLEDGPGYTKMEVVAILQQIQHRLCFCIFGLEMSNLFTWKSNKGEWKNNKKEKTTKINKEFTKKIMLNF